MTPKLLRTHRARFFRCALYSDVLEIRQVTRVCLHPACAPGFFMPAPTRCAHRVGGMRTRMSLALIRATRVIAEAAATSLLSIAWARPILARNQRAFLIFLLFPSVV